MGNQDPTLALEEKRSEFLEFFFQSKSDFLILSADPGLGKTTKLPLFLLEDNRLTGKILVIEPRRIAARSAAERTASNISEPVGKQVGYRVRWDARFSAATRLEFWTDGVFLNQILEDPELQGISAILLDEFHERSLSMDFCFALAARCRKLFRPDLKILLLSASLEGIPWSNLPLTHSKMEVKGQRYPVETVYLDSNSKRIPDRLKDILPKLAEQTPGSILVFLPGKDLIHQSLQVLSQSKVSDDFAILPLHGELSIEEQSAAIVSNYPNQRKIILSTNVAESSLTVEGITCVIDAGLEKVLHFDPESGFAKLKMQNISQSSAKQRSGRAGRTSKGLVLKLYSEFEECQFSKQRTPELLRTDLTSTILRAKAWGEELEDLPLLDKLTEKMITEGKLLLQLLDAIDESGKLTLLGKSSLEVALPPRLSIACLKLIRGNENKIALLAGIASSFQESSLSKTKLEIEKQLKKFKETDFGFSWKNEFSSNQSEDALYLAFILLAFPDRIGKLRENQEKTYKLANGKGAVLGDKLEVVNPPKFIVAMDLKGDSKSASILKYQTLEKEFLLKFYQNKILKTNSYEIVKKENGNLELSEWEEVKLFQISLSSHKLTSAKEIDPEIIHRFWIDCGKNWMEEDKEVQTFLLRAKLLYDAQVLEDLISFDYLLSRWKEWLLPHYLGKTPPIHLNGIRLLPAIQSCFSYDQMQKINREAPESIVLPSGNKATLDYSENEVSLNVRLQEIFGWMESPKIANGKYNITLSILGPGYKLVQKTKDLNQFWKSTYFEIKKELKGRYPKHHWPDDPLTAKPLIKPKPIVRKP